MADTTPKIRKFDGKTKSEFSDWWFRLVPKVKNIGTGVWDLLWEDVQAFVNADQAAIEAGNWTSMANVEWVDEEQELKFTKLYSSVLDALDNPALAYAKKGDEDQRDLFSACRNLFKKFGSLEEAGKLAAILDLLKDPQGENEEVTDFFLRKRQQGEEKIQQIALEDLITAGAILNLRSGFSQLGSAAIATGQQVQHLENACTALEAANKLKTGEQIGDLHRAQAQNNHNDNLNTGVSNSANSDRPNHSKTALKKVAKAEVKQVRKEINKLQKLVKQQNNNNNFGGGWNNGNNSGGGGGWNNSYSSGSGSFGGGGRGKKGKGKSGKGGKGKKGSTQVPSVPCGICGKMGHLGKDCWHLKGQVEK